MQHGIAVPKLCATLIPHLVGNEVRSCASMFRFRCSPLSVLCLSQPCIYSP